MDGTLHDVFSLKLKEMVQLALCFLPSAKMLHVGILLFGKDNKATTRWHERVTLSGGSSLTWERPWCTL